MPTKSKGRGQEDEHFDEVDNDPEEEIEETQ